MNAVSMLERAVAVKLIYAKAPKPNTGKRGRYKNPNKGFV